MEWLLEPRWVAAVGIAATLLAAFESIRFRWAPFIILFPVLCIALPLSLGSYAFGDFRTAFTGALSPLLVLGAALWIWEIGLWIILYEKIVLRRLGMAGDPRVDPGAALAGLADRAAAVHGIKPAVCNAILLAYVCLWAPIGEELFYWGYLFGNIAPTAGFWPAAIFTSALFALRHAFHFLYLKPAPMLPLAAVTASTFGAALLNSGIYHATGSLWPLIALHVVDNAFLVALSLPGGKDRRVPAGKT
jgi:membrane protease YdiL (CAAX protease family)